MKTNTFTKENLEKLTKEDLRSIMLEIGKVTHIAPLSKRDLIDWIIRNKAKRIDFWGHDKYFIKATGIKNGYPEFKLITLLKGNTLTTTTIKPKDWDTTQEFIEKLDHGEDISHLAEKAKL